MRIVQSSISHGYTILLCTQSEPSTNEHLNNPIPISVRDSRDGSEDFFVAIRNSVNSLWGFQGTIS